MAKQSEIEKIITGPVADILKAWVPLKMAYQETPGVAIGITYRDRLVYQQGFGFADVERGVKMGVETGMRVASISKIFTAMAMMRLVERGEVSLDIPVRRHLPWFIPGKEGGMITLRHLLTHGAGIARDGGLPHWVNDKFADRAQLRKAASKKLFVAAPMEDFRYSNFGYAILGQVIEAITGEAYNDYISRHIIRPLGLTTTTPDYVVGSDNDLAAGYMRVRPELVRQKFEHAGTEAFSAATGFVSSVKDLSRLAAAIAVSDARNLPISPLSLKEMCHQYWEADDNEWYGMGVTSSLRHGRLVVGHSGGFAGFGSAFDVDSKNGLGIIVLSNTNYSPVFTISTAIFDMVYLLLDSAEKYGYGGSVAKWRKYEGRYTSRWDDDVVVGIGRKLLCFEADTSSPIKYGSTLRPLRGHDFSIESQSKFSPRDEVARFGFCKGGTLATKLYWAGQPSNRFDS